MGGVNGGLPVGTKIVGLGGNGECFGDTWIVVGVSDVRFDGQLSSWEEERQWMAVSGWVHDGWYE